MEHRINTVKPLKNFVVSVIFQNGVKKEYDVHQLFSAFPQFRKLENTENLFEQVKVDIGGYGISWNDELDLNAEEIWRDGVDTGNKHEIDIMCLVGTALIEARQSIDMTQRELSEKVHIHQADISKIERGLANPSIQTLKRLADGMGMELKVEFLPKTKS